MSLFSYLFQLSVIIVVFTSVWKLIATLVSMLLQDIGVSKDYSFLFFKAASYYILVSITALTTHAQMSGAHPLAAALYAICGTFVLYATIAANLEKNRWRAVMRYERKRLRVMRYDGYLLMASLVLFLFTLFLPRIADTHMHHAILDVIDRIYAFPILRIFIAIFAFFYMLNMIIRGIRATGEVAQTLFGQPASPQGSQTTDDDDGYTPFEEVKED